jgi:hypothetical protein
MKPSVDSIAGRFSGNLSRIHAGIVHQPSGNFPAGGGDAADDVTALEVAEDIDDPDRQQALAACRECPCCAVVDDDAALELQMIGQPLLARCQYRS